MLLEAGAPQALGDAEGSRLRFAQASESDSAWAGRRLLLLDHQPAFELSFWCGTCPCLFQRREGATTTFSPDNEHGTDSGHTPSIDGRLIARFASLLPHGQYLPILLQVIPRLVHPAEPGDYFAHEQVATWGINGFWGLPEHPRTPYYRTYQTPVNADAHLFEFVVPMVPPSWNDQRRVAAYTAELTGAATPTAVAVAVLDVCAPAADQGPDYYAHWMLTHFLLDGHHKMQAAAIHWQLSRAVQPGGGAPTDLSDTRRLPHRRRLRRGLRSGQRPLAAGWLPQVAHHPGWLQRQPRVVGARSQARAA